MTALRYRVRPADIGAHLFEVTLDIGAVDGDVLLELPAWIPGSYMVRDYARHVVAITAGSEDGTPLAVERAAKSSWRIAAGAASACRVVLIVYAWDLSVRGAHLDASHAYFNGACLFPRVHGYSGEIDVVVDGFDALPAAAWVATSMRPVDTDRRGFGSYRVGDYDELLDHPMEIAEQQEIRFEAAGIPHRFVVRGADDDIDAERLADDCARICAAHHALLGTPDDLDRYTFLAFALDKGYGGLEHRWSSSLVISRRALPSQRRDVERKDYVTLLGLISHEYFHLWNVRRLKPRAFTPLDLSREVPTRLLWVFEGITSYYDDLALVRAGVIDAAEYLQLVGRTLTRVLRAPGRRRQSLADSSFDAWTKFYKQNENSVNAIVSYYAKGALIALALDLKLRANGEVTLDDVMRECWRRYYLDGAPGMPEDGVEQVVAALTGDDYAHFFDAAVRGTEDPDFAALLAPFGITLTLRERAGADDDGGKPEDKRRRSWAGLTAAPDAPRRIATVLADSPAAAAGLAAGDELVAVNGRKLDIPGLDAELFYREPGETLRVHAFRRDVLLDVELTLAAAPQDTAYLEFADDVGAPVRQRCERWLQSRVADADAASTSTP